MASCSDSSDDSDGGNDGVDGSSSDTDGEGGCYSKNHALDRSPSARSFDSGHANGPADDNVKEKPARSPKRQKVSHDRASITLPRLNSMSSFARRPLQSLKRPQTASMPKPPVFYSLFGTASNTALNCSIASAASFREWLLQNAALKCITINGATTYQLQFQRAPTHSCSRRQKRQSHTLLKKSRGRKPRNESKGRLCGLCKQAGHNARTCQGKKAETNPINLAR